MTLRRTRRLDYGQCVVLLGVCTRSLTSDEEDMLSGHQRGGERHEGHIPHCALGGIFDVRKRIQSLDFDLECSVVESAAVSSGDKC